VKTWRSEAACLGMDPAVFFPDKEESASRALLACASCPVQEECRTDAIERREPFGIWGGTRGRQRQEIWRKQDRERRQAS
jgi:WhiB family redox-sensing transcriptional regulator